MSLICGFLGSPSKDLDSTSPSECSPAICCIIKDAQLCPVRRWRATLRQACFRSPRAEFPSNSDLNKDSKPTFPAPLGASGWADPETRSKLICYPCYLFLLHLTTRKCPLPVQHPLPLSVVALWLFLTPNGNGSSKADTLLLPTSYSQLKSVKLSL